jgi:hypothetical protein
MNPSEVFWKTRFMSARMTMANRTGFRIGADAASQATSSNQKAMELISCLETCGAADYQVRNRLTGVVCSFKVSANLYPARQILIIKIKNQGEQFMKTGFFLFLALFLLAPVHAESQALFKNLTVEEVKRALDQQEKVLIVDNRTSQEYREGHIPTAINIPPQDFSSLRNHLPEDRNVALVFYCRGYS